MTQDLAVDIVQLRSLVAVVDAGRRGVRATQAEGRQPGIRPEGEVP